MMEKSKTESDDRESEADVAMDDENTPAEREVEPASTEATAEQGVSDVATEPADDASGADEYVPPDAEAYQMLVENAAKAELYLNELLRVKADLDNYQKRVRRERPSWEATAVRGVVRDLLPILDNFERAIDMSGEGETDSGDAGESSKFVEGVRMIFQMLKKTFDDHGVEEIEALGKPFDPDLHEAVFEMPTPDRETGEVIEVQQKGFVHREFVVRPSLVVVAKKVEAGVDATEGPSADAEE